MRYLAIALVSFIALTGFNAYGPFNEANYVERASAALPPESGEVMMSGRGYWVPNSNGFTDVRSQVTPLLGSVLITSEGVFFQQWLKAESRYDTVGRLLFSDLESVRVDEYGRSLRVVMKRHDLSVTSIAYFGQRGEFIDKEQTRKALELIETLLVPPRIPDRSPASAGS